MVNKSPAAPEVSVILTAHGEGRLAHKSAKSAKRAARLAESDGVGVELIAVLDRPAPETLAYFAEWGAMFGTVLSVEAGDRGLARNRGAEAASGRYLAFLDPGALFSENWLAAAHELARRAGDERLVLHPELNLFYEGEEVCAAESLDSDAPGYTPLELLQFNPWTPLTFVARSFFLGGNLYAPVAGGAFGRQQWHWDCEAAAAGAVHRLVPRTVHFVKRARAEEPERPFRPSRLFDSASVKTAAELSPSTAAGAEATAPAAAGRTDAGPLTFVKSRAREGALGFLRPRPDLMRVGLEVNRALKEYRARRAPSRGSVLLSEREWLAREWAGVHEVEPELYPARAVLEKLTRRAAPRSTVARRYAELDALLGEAPTHVYLMPWVKGGGVDVEAILFMRAALEREPQANITCVTTEPEDSPWLSKLPAAVKVLEFGREFVSYLEEDRHALLLRLLLQKRPRVIHNLNSPLGYRLFEDAGPALADGSELFISSFGVDFMPEGNVGGLAVRDLPRCFDHLTGVLTDSGYFVRRLCDMHGFDRSKFSVVYVPAPERRDRQREYRGGGDLQILWASRLDTEKRLDVLYSVASELTGLPFHFHVHGGEVLKTANHEAIAALSALPNVTRHGPYDGFASLPVDEYDVFLYTSERDGMPNVLLEAAACGLPVIAPDVGGIGEFINGETGFLVGGPEGVGEYVDYLKKIQGDYRVVFPKTEAARRLIESRHSWGPFVRSLERLPGYFA